MKKYSYDIEKYNFVLEVKNLFEVKTLSNIHKEWEKAISYDVLDNAEKDQDTIYHRHFYDNIEFTRWYSLYNSFIKEKIQPLIGEDILYQKIPTFRVHLPFNLSVAEFHRDRDYSHSKYEKNIYLPLTKAFGNNTIWAETKHGMEDFRSLEANIGEIWLWDGANLLHGNKINDTGQSRVSVDFRILPVSKYENNNNKSITNKTKMIIGEYWQNL